jgi:hypothetical protein
MHRTCPTFLCVRVRVGRSVTTPGFPARGLVDRLLTTAWGIEREARW